MDSGSIGRPSTPSTLSPVDSTSDDSAKVQEGKNGTKTVEPQDKAKISTERPPVPPRSLKVLARTAAQNHGVLPSVQQKAQQFEAKKTSETEEQPAPKPRTRTQNGEEIYASRSSLRIQTEGENKHQPSVKTESQKLREEIQEDRASGNATSNFGNIKEELVKNMMPTPSSERSENSGDPSLDQARKDLEKEEPSFRPRSKSLRERGASALKNIKLKFSRSQSAPDLTRSEPTPRLARTESAPTGFIQTEKLSDTPFSRDDNPLAPIRNELEGQLQDIKDNIKTMKDILSKSRNPKTLKIAEKTLPKLIALQQRTEQSLETLDGLSPATLNDHEMQLLDQPSVVQGGMDKAMKAISRQLPHIFMMEQRDDISDVKDGDGDNFEEIEESRPQVQPRRFSALAAKRSAASSSASVQPMKQTTSKQNLSPIPGTEGKPAPAFREAEQLSETPFSPSENPMKDVADRLKAQLDDVDSKITEIDNFVKVAANKKANKKSKALAQKALQALGSVKEQIETSRNKVLSLSPATIDKEGVKLFEQPDMHQSAIDKAIQKFAAVRTDIASLQPPQNVEAQTPDASQTLQILDNQLASLKSSIQTLQKQYESIAPNKKSLKSAKNFLASKPLQQLEFELDSSRGVAKAGGEVDWTSLKKLTGLVNKQLAKSKLYDTTALHNVQLTPPVVK
ncbi:hypothetical protein [Parendozoicomonas sp. Alg238-R29]|uniref:hypothetical protein n=1 Tax=Parendozoicomonas sp. Alg238-R29 TaxID=2993446 RepID=UPI00248E038B|nr:hypothetical protein [Parendozoicomonas sp. Alg238-R29]